MEKEITIENLQQEVAELKIKNESLEKQLEEANNEYERANQLFMQSYGELKRLRAQVFAVTEMLKNLNIEP